MQNKNKKTLFNQQISSFLTITSKVLLIGALFLIPFGSLEAKADIITPDELINLTNQERVKAGLASLKSNTLLELAAYNKAVDILENNYFAHTNPAGKPFYFWIQETGYEYQSAGENLAIDFSNVPDIVDAWMASPTHRENILESSYQEIGLAILSGKFGDHETIVVVQEFGEPITPLPSTPPATLAMESATTIKLVAGQSTHTPMLANSNLPTNPLPWAKRIQNLLNLAVMIIFSAVVILLTEKSIALSLQPLPRYTSGRPVISGGKGTPIIFNIVGATSANTPRGV